MSLVAPIAGGVQQGKLAYLQALQQLFCARRVLGNSYVSAFYFFGNDMFSDEITPEQNEINKSLFEDQQACLETEVILVPGPIMIARASLLL